MPSAIINLLNTRDILRAEAAKLRADGRVALAISVEREAREADTRLTKAVEAYRKLGML